MECTLRAGCLSLVDRSHFWDILKAKPFIRSRCSGMLNDVPLQQGPDVLAQKQQMWGGPRKSSLLAWQYWQFGSVGGLRLNLDWSLKIT